jgi:hypothetical protein
MTHEKIDAALTKREVRKHTINFYRLFTDQHYYENILQQYCHSNRYYTIIYDNLQPLKREDISVELYKGYRWW